MPEFVFFKKGNKTTALEKSDVQGAALFINQGYEKQFEEIIAPDGQHALARLADIKKEEEIAPFAWATGAAFFGVIFAIMMVVGYLFGN
ncbi:hypothetical protein C6560_18795 [Enterobacter sp. FS01]|uniref:hypothetical protein n=1 Tax=unclassified Leclercia TaxID=2627398 RepID=UPI000D126748|nr:MULTISPECIES: hypothetical protein [unclassified Leclercia]MCT9844382.1 hypothetical protein [Leclercia adecarboxylata ATCC 23216 = NBRC 102595]MDY0922266.1 hypothetical protein [Leclercia sp. CFBP8987]PSS46910.1 hypothetical protein C6560_18795 [Enterobacter sp. FS01]